MQSVIQSLEISEYFIPLVPWKLKSTLIYSLTISGFDSAKYIARVLHETDLAK